MNADWISRRDAIERVARLATEAEGASLYRSATRIRDKELIDALRERATELGWNLESPTAETPLTRDDLKAMTTEQILQAQAEGRLEHILATPVNPWAAVRLDTIVAAITAGTLDELRAEVEGTAHA